MHDAAGAVSTTTCKRLSLVSCARSSHRRRCVFQGHMRKLAALLDAAGEGGADARDELHKGQTPLFAATKFGRLDAMRRRAKTLTRSLSPWRKRWKASLRTCSSASSSPRRLEEPKRSRLGT